MMGTRFAMLCSLVTLACTQTLRASNAPKFILSRPESRTEEMQRAKRITPSSVRPTAERQDERNPFVSQDANDPTTESLNHSIQHTWLDFPKAKGSPLPAWQQTSCVEQVTIKSRLPRQLDSLTFSWQGKSLENISASLYEQRFDERMLPIESNLVADAQWSRAHQKLTFSVNRKIVGKQSYYLVVTYPFHLRRTLRTGSFDLALSNEAAPSTS